MSVDEALGTAIARLNCDLGAVFKRDPEAAAVLEDLRAALAGFTWEDVILLRMIAEMEHAYEEGLPEHWRGDEFDRRVDSLADRIVRLLAPREGRTEP